jgi:DNA-directed RNA polymerase
MKVTKDTTQAEWELELLGDVRDKTLHSQELMSKLTKVLVKNGQYQLASLDKIPSYFKKFDKQVVAGLLAIDREVTDDDIFTFIQVGLAMAFELIMCGGLYHSKQTLATAVTNKIWGLALATQYMTNNEYKAKTLIDSRSKVGWSQDRINAMMATQARKQRLPLPFTREALTKQVHWVMEIVNLTQLVYWKQYGKNKQTLMLHDWVVQELDGVVDRVINSTSTERAMIEEPIPYNEYGVGGFHTPVLQELNNMYIGTAGHKLQDTQCLARYIDTINYMQKTEWMLNKPILHLLEKLVNDPDYMQEYQSAFFGVTEHQDITDDMPVGLKKKYNQDNQKSGKVVDAYRYTLREALMYEDADTLWFTWFIDYRGRFYPRAGLLSPQGNKVSKALLQFKRGSRLLSQQQVNIYKMEIVKMFGFDKLPMDERLNKFKELEPVIIETGKALLDGIHPPHHKVWGGNKESMQCLAYCVEWYKIHKSPLGALVHLPVTIDGTCNGLQHISAVLRDTELGKAVNLLPDTGIQDIYTEAVIVGKRHLIQLDAYKYAKDMLIKKEAKRLSGKANRPTKQHFKEAEEIVTEEEIKDTALQVEDIKRFWLSQNLTRKITKSAVMTIPYGSVAQTQRESILQSIGGFDIPKDETGGQIVLYKAVLIDCFAKGVSEVTASANSLQVYLKSYISEMVKMGDEVNLYNLFKTPFGLPVFSPKKGSGKRTSLKLGVTFPYKTHSIFMDALDNKFTANIEKLKYKCSPNVIHSYDACHMIMTLEKFEFRVGEQNVWMVHDSYGCSPQYMEVLMEETRNMFIELHEQYPLNMCLQYPYKMLQFSGELDLQEVKKSKYFFH